MWLWRKFYNLTMMTSSLHDCVSDIAHRMFNVAFPISVNAPVSDRFKVIDLQVSDDFIVHLTNEQFGEMLLQATQHIQRCVAQQGIDANPVLFSDYCRKTLTYRCRVDLAFSDPACRAILAMQYGSQSVLNTFVFCGNGVIKMGRGLSTLNDIYHLEHSV